METEVVSKEGLGNAVATVSVDAFGDGGISASDIVIPKILCMQGLSKLVTEGTAKFGDLVSSLDNQVVGNIEKDPLEFIPFHLHKVWIISKKKEGSNRYDFDRMEDVTTYNENKKWEEVVDGVQYKNEKSFNFYSILPSDPSLPYIIQFKSTSAKSGKELSTQMYVKNKAAGLVPPARTMFLKGAKVTNDNGTYAVLKTEISRESTKEEIDKCLEWYQVIKSGTTKVAEEQF